MRYSKDTIKKFQKALMVFEKECGVTLDVQHDNNNQIIIYTNVFEDRKKGGPGYVYHDEPKA